MFKCLVCSFYVGTWSKLSNSCQLTWNHQLGMGRKHGMFCLKYMQSAFDKTHEGLHLCFEIGGCNGCNGGRFLRMGPIGHGRPLANSTWEPTWQQGRRLLCRHDMLPFLELSNRKWQQVVWKHMPLLTASIHTAITHDLQSQDCLPNTWKKMVEQKIVRALVLAAERHFRKQYEKANP